MTESATTPQGEIPLRAVIDAALHLAEERGERVVIVGGFVRDLVMRRPIGDYDLDLVVEGDAPAFSTALRGVLGGELREHRSFLTAKILAPFFAIEGKAPYLSEVDIANARTEEYTRPGALPVVKAASLDKDLWRRDFACNALALPLTVYRDFLDGRVSGDLLASSVIDPCGGLSDIASSTLRVLHSASFTDDPTRLFRAVRYSVRLSFHFDRGTLSAFFESVKNGALATLTTRRVWNEVLSALDEESPSEVLQEYLGRGLFSNLPILDHAAATEVFEALERIESHRELVSADAFREAAKLLIIGGLLWAGREDVAQALSEGKQVLKRAWERWSQGGCSPELANADLLAAYGTTEESECLTILRSRGRDV